MQKFHLRILFVATVLVNGFNSAAQALEPIGNVSNNKTKQFLPSTIVHKIDLPKYSTEVKIREVLKLDLKSVKRLVEVNNPSLEAMKLKVEQEKYKLIAALSAWYPSINLSANGLPQYLKGDQSNDPGADLSSEQWKASLAVEVKWNLVDPARIPEIAAAKDTYEKAKSSYLITLRDLHLKAASQFFLLQQADEGVRIGQQSVDASEISLNDAKTRFKAGVGTRLEVLEAETQLARDKQLLTTKIGDQNINQRLLAQILNLPSQTTPKAANVPQIIGSWRTSLEDSIIAAYAFREELEKLLLDISISNSNANSALALSQPSISLFNTLSRSYSKGELLSSSPDMDKTSSTYSNTVGINATWNIFDGGKAKALYKYNKKKAKEAEQNFFAERNSIRQEVEESFYQLETSKQDIITTNHEVVASKESLRLARLRFQAGVTTQREVVNNQRDLTEAEVRFSDAITSYNTSLMQLGRRTGINYTETCIDSDYDSTKLQLDNEQSNPTRVSLPIIHQCDTSGIKRKI